MTWLDVQEENNRFIRTCMRTPEPETRSERMARVIRELVDYIKVEDVLPIVYETEAAAKLSETMRNNLSSDTKELLND